MNGIPPVPERKAWKMVVKERRYTVKKGDNLWNIVKKHYGAKTNTETLEIAACIASFNKIKNPDLIKPGQKLELPKLLLSEKPFLNKQAQKLLKSDTFKKQLERFLRGPKPLI